MSTTHEGMALNAKAESNTARSLPLSKKKEPVFQNAPRIQQSFTAPAERRCLAWLAAHTPGWINSDHLTLLGLISMIGAGAGYALVRWNRIGLICATVSLGFNWLGDSLDGTLARFRNRQRPRYGFYVDHVVDMLGGLALMSGLAISRLVDWRIALAMFVSYLMLSTEVYLATYTVGSFRLSFAGFGPTEIRLLLAIGNVTLCVNPHPWIFGTAYRLFDVAGLIATAGILLMLGISIVRNTRQLYREEPVR